MTPPSGTTASPEGAARQTSLSGRGYSARLVAVPRGVGQGQVAASGILARVGSTGGARAYPAQISIPDGTLDSHQTRDTQSTPQERSIR
jgi:hypothetical protein